MFTNWAVVYYGYENRAVHLDVELLISVLRIVDINNWEQILIPLAIAAIVAAIVAATDRRDDRLIAYVLVQCERHRCFQWVRLRRSVKSDTHGPALCAP